MNIEETGYQSYINPEILKQRAIHVNENSQWPQIHITLTVCLGVMAFGSVFGWGSPTHHHLSDLIYDDIKFDHDTEFVWMIILAPMAAASRALICFLRLENSGPRKIMMFQAPFLIITWTIMAFQNNYKIYYTVQFFNGFFAFGYIYQGEKLLCGTIHRRHLKTAFISFTTSFYLGVLLMGVIGSKLTKWQLCLLLELLVVLCTTGLYFLPESPVFLMNNNEQAAKKSLAWYRGGSETQEIEIIKNYISLMKSNDYSLTILYRKKAIYKPLVLVGLLELLISCSGYSVFIVIGTDMLSEERCVISPYLDNIFYMSATIFSHIVGRVICLHVPSPIKTQMLVSSSIIILLVFTLATYDYMVMEVMKIGYHRWVTLTFLCTFMVVSECGLSSCTDMMIYHYFPFQVYEEVRIFMFFIRWLFIATVFRIYPVITLWYGLHCILWPLTGIMIICLILNSVYMVEVKNKSLLQIQIALGGNPIGNRGSVRQRIATPFEISTLNLNTHNVNQTQSVV